MKKKRSIQKLSVHKETISNLNTITGGDLTTSAIRGTRVLISIVAGACKTDHCTASYNTQNNGDP